MLMTLLSFVGGDSTTLTNLNNFLELYGQQSGQIVNKEKSLFFVGKGKVAIQTWFSIVVGVGSF